LNFNFNPPLVHLRFKL